MKKNACLLAVLCLMGFAKAWSAPVVNFGQDLGALRQAFASGSVHILQIGDSHTAADYFTEQLRKRLQSELGDGGLGFVYPTKLPAQRGARHDYGTLWSSQNSKQDLGLDYPLGGVYATSNGDTLQITSRYYANTQQNLRLLIKGRQGDYVALNDRQGSKNLKLNTTGWQLVNASVYFPFSIAAAPLVSVGGLWLSKDRGGVVSAMGINGATQDYWLRWHSGLAKDLNASAAHLVILAYGTNEAFAQNSDQENALAHAILQIKTGLPNASILLINAPESLKDKTGDCGTPAPNLARSRQTIQALARKYGTLYWDWQEAMGGTCSMKKWIGQGLGNKDGVHFSAEGYQKSANNLYDNLKQTINFK